MTVSLETSYLGLPLASPLVASASPLGRHLDTLLRLQEAGAAAVVLPSLFQEQIESEDLQMHRNLDIAAESFAEAAHGHSQVPGGGDNSGPHRYLSLVGEARNTLTIPVIASLNGATPGDWTEYSRMIQDAGASALELNVYFIAADLGETADQVERRYLDLVSTVREAIDIPLAVKVGPYFSAMANMAQRLVEVGADGLVLFNRFYQPDIDLEELTVTPGLQLSSSAEMRLPLRWIAILRGRVKASLAATTGVHTAEDVLKLVAAGADVTMMASALLLKGPEWLRTLRADIIRWMEEHEYSSIEQMKGSMSQVAVSNPAAFERANYMEALISYATPRL